MGSRGAAWACSSERGESLLSTWVYRIALRSAWRVKARRRKSAEPLEVELNLASTDAGPDEIFATHERATRLRAAFDDLSEEQRTVLSLFAVDGLGHKEIADVLGVPEGTIWFRLHTARKRLAASMAEHEV